MLTAAILSVLGFATPALASGYDYDCYKGKRAGRQAAERLVWSETEIDFVYGGKRAFPNSYTYYDPSQNALVYVQGEPGDEKIRVEVEPDADSLVGTVVYTCVLANR